MTPTPRLRLRFLVVSAAALIGLAASSIAQDAPAPGPAPANPPPRVDDAPPGDADSPRPPRPEDGPRPPRDPGAMGPNGRPGMVRPPRPGDESQPADRGPRPNRPLFPGLNPLKDRPNKRNEPRQRERLELLARLPPAQILVELQKWPPFQKMTLGEQGQMLERIQEIKDRRREAALNKAREMGLDLTPAQQDAFELRYWTLRLEFEKKLFTEFEPRRRAMDAEATAQLSKEFAPAAPAPAPPIKTPTNTVSAPAPAAGSTNAPVAPHY